MKKPAGMKCGKDPFWVCQDGLECSDGVCKATVGKGERCGRMAKCAAPLSCVGRKKNLRCFEKKAVNMRCGKDPFWVCQDGLSCCDGVCKSGAAKGARCGDGIKCGMPLSCVGRPENRRCFMKKGLGMKCGKDPFWVCEEGLACYKGLCRRAVGKGKTCGVKKVCKDQRTCVDARCQ